jgi:hypothetical protein
MLAYAIMNKNDYLIGLIKIPYITKYKESYEAATKRLVLITLFFNTFLHKFLEAKWLIYYNS